ncbi:MAG: TonB-dependent receptor [Bacteroides sp.]|nr:TonB-dependent receptor [Bacteroides sp.]MCM1086074.1 TonB-dependent receptor [Bacteroides sp.]
MRRLFLFCLLLNATFSIGSAQRLSGRILDADGAPLPMATLQIQGGKGAVSGIDGKYSYQFPGKGVYRVAVRYTGYDPVDVVLRMVRDTTVDFTLHLAQSKLDAVVVTGTRTPKMLKDVPVVTTVISAKEIEKTGALNIADVLQTEIPGVEFSRQMDGQVVMNMQGMGGSDVLFLIDGERMAGESLNNIDYERLNMDNIERVEIVRGAGSALYGSNAIGGVVNIITKEADRPWSLNVNGRYGSNNEWKTGATLGFDKKRFNSVTNVSYKSVDTYTLKGRDSASEESIIYGGRTVNASQSFRFDLLPNLSLKVRGGFYHRERDYTEKRINRYIDGTAGVALDYNITEKAHLRADYAFDLYDKYDHFPIAGITTKEYSNMQNKANLQFDYNFTPDNILTVGAEYFNETLMSNQFDTTSGGDFKNYMAHTAVAYAQHDISFKKQWYLVYGLRMDYNSQFRLPHLSPKVSLMYKIKPVSLRLSYAGGFRAPSLKERYSNYDMGGQGWFIIYGDPKLKPEKSQNVMLSAEYAHNRFSFTASGYYCHTKDKITTVYNLKQDTAFYRNINMSHTAGFDASFMVKLPYGFGIKLNYAYVFDRQKEGGVNVSYARPHTGVARFDYHFEKAWYSLGVSLSGRVLSGLSSVAYTDRNDENGTPIYEKVHYPAYTMWKLNVNQRFMDAVSLNVGLDNIFNYKPKDYDLISSTSPGITFYVSLAVDIDGLADFASKKKSR